MRWLSQGSPAQTVRRYCDAANANDLEEMQKLLAPAFTLVDSMGERVVGRRSAMRAMRRFVQLAPDFRIEIEALSTRGRQVLIRGTSHCSDARLTRDVLWRAIADERYLHMWESFAAARPASLTRILAVEEDRAAPVELVRETPRIAV